MIRSSLDNVNVAIAKEIDGRYDNVRIVADNIDAVIEVANKITDEGYLMLDVVGLDVNTTAEVTSPGQIAWNAEEGTADLGLIGGSVLQIGQEEVRTVRNATGSTILNGTVCMYAGTIGNSGRIKVAPYSGVKGSHNYVYGVATSNIANGADGLITISGKVRGINTTGSAVGEVWVDGDVLYAKPNDGGKLTKVEPLDTELKMVVASVINAHTNGVLEVRVLPTDENLGYTRAGSEATFVGKTSNTGSAILPTGTSSQRDVGPLEGYTRYNSETKQPETFNGTVWSPAGSGQLLGDSYVKAVGFLASTTPDTIVVESSTNAFAIDNITVTYGGSITIEDGAVFKVL